MKDENVWFTCLGLILFAIISIVVGTLMNGWAVSVLWGWFVVPIFSVEPLSVLQACGLALVASILTHQTKETNKESKSTSALVVEVLAVSVLSPLFIVFFGWLILSSM